MISWLNEEASKRLKQKKVEPTESVAVDTFKEFKNQKN